MLETRVAGERLVLLPQRAAWLPELGMLLVADAHLGKAVSFRRLGVPVPRGTTEQTLARLDQALLATAARQVVFLGDLLHSARADAAGTYAAVSRWRSRHAGLALTLVRGNHDRHAGDPPAAWGVEVFDAPWRVGALALAHDPEPVDGAYVLAGHLHPGAVVGGRAHDRMRLPCFHLGPHVGVLPAFGEFTGLHVLPRGEHDRVYVVAGDAVRAVPALTTLGA